MLEIVKRLIRYDSHLGGISYARSVWSLLIITGLIVWSLLADPSERTEILAILAFCVFWWLLTIYDYRREKKTHMKSDDKLNNSN